MVVNSAQANSRAVYTPAVLRFYDTLVLGLTNRWVWRCPTQRLLQWYDQHLTGNHLEIGPGTGWFLDHCQFPTDRPRLVMLDANSHCLHYAARRLSRYRPHTIQADVMRPLPTREQQFDSVSMNYILHCLPGALPAKTVSFDHVHRVLRPGGILFGSTILGGAGRTHWAARRLMASYNRRGIFNNEFDQFEDLHEALTCRFDGVDTESVGEVVLFRGWRSGG